MITIWTILIAVLMFGFLIFAHELGHFLTAKAVGMTVEEFSIGMGPALLKRKKGETLYALRVLPIGGYVKLEGEDGGDVSSRSFSNKPFWAKLLVLIAGAFMNFLVGILLSVGLTAAQPALPSTTIGGFDENAVSSAYLQVGDRILSIHGQKVHIAQDINLILAYSGAEPVDIEVLRNGEKVLLENVSFVSGEEQGIKYYAIDFLFYRAEKNFGTVLSYGFFQTVAVTRSIWTSLVQLFTGKIAVTSLSGPVGTTQALGEAVSQGVENMLYFIMFISINLGFMNLLPFPALDGGRVALLAIEAVTRRKIDQKVEGIINLAGFALLMLLMVFVTFSDILKLF